MVSVNTFNHIWQQQINKYNEQSKDLLDAYHNMLISIIQNRCLTVAKMGLSSCTINRQNFKKDINSYIDKLDSVIPDYNRRNNSINDFYLTYDSDFWEKNKNKSLVLKLQAEDYGQNYKLSDYNLS